MIVKFERGKEFKVGKYLKLKIRNKIMCQMVSK